MMKKRIGRLLTAALLCALSVSGCKSPAGTQKDGGEEGGESHSLGFSGIDMSNPYFVTLKNAVKEEIEREGEGEYKLIVKDPAADPKKQASQLKEMTNEGVEAGL